MIVPCSDFVNLLSEWVTKLMLGQDGCYGLSTDCFKLLFHLFFSFFSFADVSYTWRAALEMLKSVVFCSASTGPCVCVCVCSKSHRKSHRHRHRHNSVHTVESTNTLTRPRVRAHTHTHTLSDLAFVVRGTPKAITN